MLGLPVVCSSSSKPTVQTAVAPALAATFRRVGATHTSCINSINSNEARQGRSASIFLFSKGNKPFTFDRIRG